MRPCSRSCARSLKNEGCFVVGLVAGVAMGFQNTWLFISGALAPIAFGALVSALGWSAGFGLMCVLAFGGWLLLEPLRDQERTGWRLQA